MDMPGDTPIAHRTANPHVGLLLAVIFVLSLTAGLGYGPDAAAQGTLGAELEGQVHSTAHEPLDGVTVSAKKPILGSAWHYHETSTDQTGAYRFEDLEAGDWTIAFQKDGYRSALANLSLETGSSTQHNATLKDLIVSEYSGVLVDAETEQPIAGAKIHVQSWTHDAPQQRHTYSDTDGSFRIALFPQDNEITITKKGYASHHDWLHAASGDVHHDAIRLYGVPPQDAVVEGRVTDAATGEGVQARVTLQSDGPHRVHAGGAEPAEPVPDIAYDGGQSDAWYPYHGNHNSTITDSQGRFSMNAYEGPVVLEADRAGYLFTRSHQELTSGGTTQVTFELKKLPDRSVTLGGTVKNAKNGSAVAGAQVNVQVPANGDRQWTQTDADGSWQVQVRPGYTLIHVSHWGQMDHTYAVEVAEDMVVAHDEAGSASAPGQQTYNEPVSHAEPARPGSRETTRYYPAVHTMNTQADSDHSVELRLQPEREPTTTIVGYVIDGESQETVPGVHVHLHNHETGAWGSAVTDDDGSYRFETHEGYHTLGVDGHGYLGGGTNTIAPASGTHRVDLEVRPGEWAATGWWSPGEQDGHEPYPMPSYPGSYSGEEAAMDTDDAASGSPVMNEMDASSGTRSGSGGLVGGPGGLGPYQPQQDPEDIPAPAGLAVLLAVVAALGTVTAMRRR